ncbi:LuxR C-terminal-related transcriptional regulator [Massilia sp. W12]|uniref:LuxR C-terminal-related transcriptional regulator n=1 Tax=Massilia sp. W12 TaxID=3126507 RepID=UPI0030D46C7C
MARANELSTAQNDTDGLTPRQRQILQLLSEGKVNKEIAQELQIGVGTVKQHVVALFKRLHVSNRAMAVARSKQQAPRSVFTSQPQDTILQRRPCLILCIELPPAHARLRQLHGHLAGCAYQYDALLLARKGHVLEMVFGLSRISENEAIKILALLQTLYPLAGSLRAVLSAGLLCASMYSQGGWSGEAIAGASLGRARELLRQTKPEQLLIASPCCQLLEALGMIDPQTLSQHSQADGHACFELDGLHMLYWRGERPACARAGREQEWAMLSQALERMFAPRKAAQPCPLLLLSGETGMGKSMLCRELANLALARQLPLMFLRVVADVDGVFLHDVICGVSADCAKLEQIWRGHGLCIIDDLHLLPPAQQIELIHTVQQRASLLLLSARRFVPALGTLAPVQADLRLQHLPPAAIQDLISTVWRQEAGQHTLGRQQLQQLCELAGGVPLFALELARHCKRRGVQSGPERRNTPGLTLALIVCARLDELQLDCRLLQMAACNPGITRNAWLQAGGAESALQLAIASGVLRGSGSGAEMRLQIAHPMVEMVLAWLAEGCL